MAKISQAKMRIEGKKLKLGLHICHYMLVYIHEQSNWFAVQFLGINMVHWKNVVQVDFFFFFFQ